MRRLLNVGLVALACVGFAACSSDEPAANNGNTPWKGGETAYLKVQLNSTGDMTRGTDGGKADGTITHRDGDLYNESKVANARFFFYDNEGNFVIEGTIADQLTGAKPADQDNIEFKSDELLVLDGIKIRPTFVVTVLNTPTDWEAPATLSAFNDLQVTGVCGSTKATDWINGTTSADSEKLFTMLSSTYESGEVYPFVTRIAPDNYQSTMAATSDVAPVDIYVERVQAKVTVDCDITDQTPEAYKFTRKVNGKDVETTVNAYPLDSSIKVNGLANDVTVYAALLGFEATATTSDSYMLKHIDTNWQAATLGFTWSEPFNFRTYWAKSYNYGVSAAVYPDRYTTDMNAELFYENYGGTQTEEGARFNFFGSDTQNISSDYVPVDYAFENTNTEAVLKGHYPSAMTGALIKAKLLVKKDGVLTPQDVIRYRGNLYTPEAYIAYVYGVQRTMNLLNYQYATSAATDAKADITADMLTIGDADYLNGRVVVTLKPEYEESNAVWTNKAGETVTAAEVNNQLAQFNEMNEAIGYKGGDMYYYIPIEHLNNAANTTNSYGQITGAPEGKYGVVRNHWYQLTITGVSNIGQGVWEPDEPIVPNPGDNLYTLSAKVNVLAWKIVKQSFSL
jgi:hypothetical protein